MIRILAYMDFDSPTGFSKVSKEIFKGLEPFFTKHGIKVDIVTYQKIVDNRELYPGVRTFHAKEFAENMIDKFYRDGFLKRITQKPYDLVWIMNDWPMISPAMPVVKSIQDKIKENFNKKGKKQLQKDGVKAYTMNNKPPFKTLVYFPIDSELNPSLTRNLDMVDRAITYTQYGKESVKNSFNRFIPMLRDFGDTELADRMQKWSDQNDIGVIHHGIDTQNFYHDRAAGLEHRKLYEIPQDAFVFGNVNKNQPRKNVAQTIVAFAGFKQKLKEIDYQSQSSNLPFKSFALYLHCHPFDPTGVNLIAVCEAMGLIAGEDVFFPIMEKYEKAEYTEQDMNSVYNMFDCFVTTSMAEGWGLTLSEAVACDIPAIYGDHTSQKEIMVSHSGLSTGPVGMPVWANDIHFQPGDEQTGKRHKLDTPTLIDSMVRVFLAIQRNQIENQKNPDNRVLNTGLINGYSNIVNRYTWEQACQMWEKELSDILNL